MVGDSVNANVVLSADTSQYDRSMQASANSTEMVANQVDSLVKKLDDLSKSTGRKLMGIAALDIGAITAATAAYGAYEEQIEKLQSQASILNKDMQAQQRTFASYERSVQGLRKEFGTTTREATELTKQISKMTDESEKISDLAETFTKMGHATGESSTGLARSVLDLQRVMGSSQRDTKDYADQLTTLAANSNTSATALADFSSQLAPVGRLIGQNLTDINGVASAFSKAGQEGFRAANAYNRIASDIAYATKSGSPELAKYANLVGMTVEGFKELEGTEKVVKIFDELARKGPSAVTDLNRLGLDGVRNIKSITAIAQQGGLGGAIQESRDAFGNGAVNRGSKSTMEGMADELKKLRSEVAMTAESFGKSFEPAFKSALNVVEKFMSGVRVLVDGPLGDLLKIFAAIAAPVTAFAGATLLLAGTLAKLAAVALVVKGSGFKGMMEGFKGGSKVVPLPGGGYGPAAGGRLGATGQQVAARGSWFQRGAYNSMAGVGGFFGGMRGPGPTFDPAKGNVFSRAMAAPLNVAAWGVRNVGTPVYSPLAMKGWNDPTARERLFKDQRNPAQQVKDRIHGVHPAQQIKNTIHAAGAGAASKGMDDVAKKAAPLSRGLGNLTKSVGGLAAAMGSAFLMLGKLGAGAAGSLAGMASKALMSPMGMMLGIPLAFMGAGALGGLGDNSQARFKDMGASGDPYKDLAGIEKGQVFTPGVEAEDTLTLSDAKTIGIEDVIEAKDPDHKLLNKGLYGKSEDETVAYLATQWDDYKNNAKARQAVTLDLIDKFDAEVAGDILQRLDSGESPGMDAFFKGDWTDTDKEGAGDRISNALQYIEDISSNAIGTGTAQSVRTRNTVQALSLATSGIGDQGQISSEQLAALGVVSDQLFGGNLDTSKEGILRTFMDPTGFDPKFGTPTGYRPSVGSLPADASNKETKKWMKDLFTELNDSEGMDAFKSFAGFLGMDWKKIKAGLDEGNGDEMVEFAKALAQDQGMNPVQRLRKRISRSGIAGRILMGSEAARYAADEGSGDMAAQFAAVKDIYSKLAAEGLSSQERIATLGAAQASIGDASDPQYGYVSAVRQREQFGAEQRQALMTPSAKYSDSAKNLGALLAIDDPNLAEEKEAAGQAFIQQTTQMGQYFQQLLIQQENFELQKERNLEDFDITRSRMEEQYNIQRERAQYQFHLQRKYQEEDYQKSRRRAEASFNRSKRRGEESFDRSMRRGRQDFNISRMRQERDYQHQVRLMTKQTAEQMYNIYERINVQRTSSVSYLLVNARDQLDQVKQQTDNLDRLRKMGVSDDAINQLGFTDSQNAQQLARFVSEVADNPQMIKKMNNAIKKRLKAARDLVTDESSQDWREFQRQYNLSANRAQKDFKRSVRRAHKDFKIQMQQMSFDFQLQMFQQATDYEVSQKRQQKSFSLSMKNSAEDYGRAVNHMTDDFGRAMDRAQENMNRMARNVSQSLTKIFRRASNELGGEIGKQARETLGTFNNLESALGETGYDIMLMMSQIFGFPAPKKPKKKGGGGGGKNPPASSFNLGGGHSNTGGAFSDFYTKKGYADGGVLPGRSIGRDNMTFHSPLYGSLGLAGGEAIMVPEWVDQVGGPQAIKAMNDKARKGFASGGQIPAAGSWGQHHDSKYNYARYAGDINIPGPSDYGNPVRAWKDGVIAEMNRWTTSYGNHIKINHPGSSERTLYAHLSRFGNWSPGDEVKRGQIIGRVGSTGNSSGPHLHFEVIGGTSPIVPGVGGSGMGSLKSILDYDFSKVENAASKVKLMGGLFEDGFWTKKIMGMARKVANKHGGLGSLSGHGDQFTPVNWDIEKGSNEHIVRQAMRAFGWRGQWPAMHSLVTRESGFDNHAQNPSSTAYGMFQFLDGTWAGTGVKKTSDPTLQALAGMRYIKNRYGDPRGAWDFWTKNNWYGDGAVFDSPQMIGVGEKGPEMVLPLNDQGAGFVQEILSRTQAGLGAKHSNVPYSSPLVNTIHNFHVDRSTNFTGPITVQANNPAELINQLRQRQRVMGLSQAAMGGKRL